MEWRRLDVNYFTHFSFEEVFEYDNDMHGPGYDRYMSSPDWKAKRFQRLELDGHRCQGCGTTQRLHVHHLTYSHLGDEPMGDLVTACKDCHDTIHEIHRKMLGVATAQVLGGMIGSRQEQGEAEISLQERGRMTTHREMVKQWLVEHPGVIVRPQELAVKLKILPDRVSAACRDLCAIDPELLTKINRNAYQVSSRQPEISPIPARASLESSFDEDDTPEVKESPERVNAGDLIIASIAAKLIGKPLQPKELMYSVFRGTEEAIQVGLTDSREAVIDRLLTAVDYGEYNGNLPAIKDFIKGAVVDAFRKAGSH